MTASPPAPAAPPRTPWLRLAVGALLLAGLGAAWVRFQPQRQLQAALDWVAGLGPWAPLLFILLYVLACVLLVPGSVLTLGAGAVFGVWRGSVLVSVAATLGASAAFLLGRRLARRAVERRVAASPAFAAVDEAVAREGWRIVLLTRLSPVFPFTLLNYAYGVTRVTFREYFLASWLGMLPGTVLYVYLGAVAGELALAGAGARARTPAEWALLGLGLLATVAVTVVITRIARRALAQRLHPAPPTPPR